MTNGDCAAVYVHNVGVPAHIFVDGKRLRGKRSVCFDKVEIRDLPAGFFERLARGWNWPRTHDLRVHTGRCPRDDGCKWLHTSACGLCPAHDHERRRTIIEAGRIA